ncbi:putative predicted SAM-dependent RNA methyltransferase [Lyophyllum shimeji]|uniref:Predicted SAM-dependent RNA methyltransferase n=1 Tax=Lyophyllum shimeji TaxID=47721 RepID=A0A9P3UPY7_LYOSH|nr:putative predicted SAM-dependent RNA methyltransferase [Lyophyllum shimeji]
MRTPRVNSSLGRAGVYAHAYPRWTGCTRPFHPSLQILKRFALDRISIVAGGSSGGSLLPNERPGSDEIKSDGRFDMFLFGVVEGIPGNDPPRYRTAELRVMGFPTRHLGPVQMTTDTALGVTKLVINDKKPISKYHTRYDFPTIRLNSKESVEMPFRYIADKGGEPLLPLEMRELLHEDLDKALDNFDETWAARAGGKSHWCSRSERDDQDYGGDHDTAENPLHRLDSGSRQRDECLNPAWLAPNNHGTFYYNQLASLKLLVNDYEGALNVTDAYFAHQFLTQINAIGEQPYEAVWTRPHHYRAYILAELILHSRNLPIFLPCPGSLPQNTIAEDGSQQLEVRVSKEAPISTVPSSGPASASPPRTPAVPPPISRSARPPSSSSSGQGQGRRRSPRRDQRPGATSEIVSTPPRASMPVAPNGIAYTKELYPSIAAVAAIYGDPSGI